MLGIAVIGTGNIGADHARRLAHQVAGAEVVAVFDVDAERAAHVARSVGAVSHSSATDAIADVNVDAVLVASPGAFHTEANLASIAALTPVLC
ncbi:MAG: Gfo/Idh/MocA family protein [Acidimicrobiales bacterium]